MARIRRYGRGDRIYVQAQQIWLILTGFVSGPTRKPSDSKAIKYGELAVLMGYDDGRAGHTLGRQLGIVGRCCVANGLPALNSIVVNATTEAPGDEVVVTGDNTWRQEQKAVFKQNWYRVGVPTTGTLREFWESAPYR